MSTLEIILGVLSTILIALGTNSIKEYFNYKKYSVEVANMAKAQDAKLQELKLIEEEKSEKRQLWLDERLASMENKFSELSEKVGKHIIDSDFETLFRNRFKNFVRNIRRVNETLEAEYLDAFMLWAGHIEEYAISFYKDNYRNHNNDFTKHKLSMNLEDDMDKIINSFNTYLHLSEIGGVKIWNNEEYTFGKYIKDKKINLHSSSLALVQILEQNGLNTLDKFSLVFENHINRWFSNFTVAIKIWKDIQRN